MSCLKCPQMTPFRQNGMTFIFLCWVHTKVYIIQIQIQQAALGAVFFCCGEGRKVFVTQNCVLIWIKPDCRYFFPKKKENTHTHTHTQLKPPSQEHLKTCCMKKHLGSGICPPTPPGSTAAAGWDCYRERRETTGEGSHAPSRTCPCPVLFITDCAFWIKVRTDTRPIRHNKKIPQSGSGWRKRFSGPDQSLNVCTYCPAVRQSRDRWNSSKFSPLWGCRRSGSHLFFPRIEEKTMF